MTLSNAGSGAGTVTLSGALGNGSGSLGLTQNSTTSSLILSGTNTFTGLTTINAGTLQLATLGAFNNQTRTVTVNPTGVLQAVNLTNVYAGCTINLNGGKVVFGRPSGDKAAAGNIVIHADSEIDSYQSSNATSPDYNTTISYGSLDFTADGYTLHLTDTGLTYTFRPAGTRSQFNGSTIAHNATVNVLNGYKVDARGAPTFELNNTLIRAGKTLTVTQSATYGMLDASASLAGSLGVCLQGGAELLGSDSFTMLDGGTLAGVTDTTTFDTTGGLWSKAGTTAIAATLAHTVGSLSGKGSTASFASSSAAYVSLHGLGVGTTCTITLTLANAADQSTVFAQLAKNPVFTGLSIVSANQIAVQFTAPAATSYFAWDNVHTASDWHLGGNLTAVTLSEPNSSSAYGGWAAGPFAGTLTDTDPSHDFDGGGLPTGVEWVTGGDPTTAADDASHTPTFDNTSDPDYFIFTYLRTQAANSDPNTTIKVEYGSTLGSWTPAIDDGNNIIITPTINGGGAGVDLVQVKLKRTLAVDNKLFTRLNVVVATP